MENQFSYLMALANQYQVCSDDESKLFDVINQIPDKEVQEIFNEYGDPENIFQPVNLLRAEVARQLLQGVDVTDALVEEIKDHIRAKDTKYFRSFGRPLLDGLREYQPGKRDMFANWTKQWSVFHTYFYRGTVK